MAGDWIPVEEATPTKLEVQSIADATGRSRHEVFGRLVEFWLWAQKQTDDGTLPRASVESLASLLGPDVDFWRAVVRANWLKKVRGGLKIPRAENWLTLGAKSRLVETNRKAKYRREQKLREEEDAAMASENVPEMSQDERDNRGTTEQNRTEQNRLTSESDSDHKEIHADDDSVQPSKSAQPSLVVQNTHFVGDLFRRANYAGDDGAIFWRAAALVERGKIPDRWAIDAAVGTGAADTKNAPGYFRTILEEHCTKARVDLGKLLQEVRIGKKHPKGAPPTAYDRSARSGEQPVGALASGLLERLGLAATDTRPPPAG